MIGTKPPGSAPQAAPGPPSPPRPSGRRPPSVTGPRLRAIALGPLVIGLVVVLVAIAIKAAYGGFAHDYPLTVRMPRAGQNVLVGSDVRERGVVIGSVSAIRLVDRQVELTLMIHPQYRVPADAVASVDLKTLLGAKFLDLRSTAFGGPFLASGATLGRTEVGPELEDVLADGVNVLDAIRPADLATVLSNLAQGAQGHGQDIARSLQANADLSRLFAETMAPQLKALHDFVVVFGTLRNSGVDLNALADAVNQGVPVYASPKAEAALRAALTTLVPFANNLADLLIVDRPQWDRLMDDGDAVLGAVQMNAAGLQSLVQGLYRYVYRLGGKPFPVGDGSASAGFVAFIGGDGMPDVQQQICGALPAQLRKLLPLCGGKR